MAINIKKLGLYIHIPFCKKKCDYCDFLSFLESKEMEKQYIDALLDEIRCYQGEMREYEVDTIFFGGGTPSIIDASYIKEILNELKNVFCFGETQRQVEITLEANPGTLTKDKLTAYYQMGINRFSMGLQSANNSELNSLGRIHTYEEFLCNYREARGVGFTNINIDLMSGLPGQTLKSFLDTLSCVTDLEPEHLSIYSLMIEKGTPFFEKYKTVEDRKQLPSEELDRKFYEATKKYLERKEYNRYEISNYARKGFECRHNSSYWIGTDYLGLGLGASSLMNHKRFHNEENLLKYIRVSKNPIALRREEESLTKIQEMEEFMFLGLRLMNGILITDFFKRFECSIYQVYGEAIQKLKEQKLLMIDGERIYLSERGIDVSNQVFVEFLQ